MPRKVLLAFASYLALATPAQAQKVYDFTVDPRYAAEDAASAGVRRPPRLRLAPRISREARNLFEPEGLHEGAPLVGFRAHSFGTDGSEIEVTILGKFSDAPKTSSPYRSILPEGKGMVILGVKRRF